MEQSQIDGEYYCKYCRKDSEECRCPSEEEREAMRDEEADSQRNIKMGL